MKNYQEVDFGTRVGFVCGAVALLFVLAGGGCASDPPQRTRIVTAQAQVEAAQQAAKEAQTAADRAEQTRKDIQAAVAKLDNAGRDSDGKLKPGHAEVTGAGIVTEVGYTDHNSEGSGVGYNTGMYFVFAERAGFTKRFDPVCPGNNIPVGKTVTLNFHWREYASGSSSNTACYALDGFTVVP